MFQVGDAITQRLIYSNHLDDLVGIDVPGVRYFVLSTPDGWADALVDDQGAMVERYLYGLDGELIVLDPGGALRALADVPRFCSSAKSSIPRPASTTFGRAGAIPGSTSF